jgi:hypothetical protein
MSSSRKKEQIVWREPSVIPRASSPLISMRRSPGKRSVSSCAGDPLATFSIWRGGLFLARAQNRRREKGGGKGMGRALFREEVQHNRRKI